MDPLKKAFFDKIREQRRLLEGVKERPLVDIPPAEQLWTYVEYVGNFLIEYGTLTEKDLNIARGMVEDYEERLGTLLP